MKRVGLLLICLCLLLTVFPFGATAFQTDCTNIEVVVGNEILPLPEYPVGSKCLNFGDGSVYPLPNGGGIDVRAYQCFGFARYVFYRCFGVLDFYDEGGGGYHCEAFDVTPEEITEEYLRSLFNVTVFAGAHIRASDGNSGHSMVYLTCDDRYVYTYEGNYDYACGVTVNRRTWDEFVTYCRRKGGIRFIHMPDTYPEPACPGCPGAGYADMPPVEHWAHEGLHFVLGQGLFVGTTDTTVSPNLSMSRAMLVTVLWRLAGEPETESELSFFDVHQDDWFAPAVSWAAQTGVVSGIGDGTFRPNQTVTREQIAAVMHRYVQLCTDLLLQSGDASELLGEYEDEGTVSGWAKEDMAWAVANGLISGKLNQGELLLDAGGGGTRAEVASVIQRFCALLVE